MGHVQLTWTDCTNITRCHVVRHSRFDSVCKNGLGFGRFMFGFPYFFGLPVVSATGQVTFRPDKEDPLQPIPWLPDAQLCFGQFFEDDGTPCTICPRAFLAKQDKILDEAGLSMGVGFELEFYVAKEDGSPINSATYSESKALRGTTWNILTKSIKGMEACGIPVWRYHQEGSSGQLEIAIGPFTGSMVKAADCLVLARQAIYHAALEFGCLATFLPRPYDTMGTGAHTHISLRNKQGKNAFDLSSLDGNAFLAGIYENLPNMMLIYAPTGNSYDRLKPSFVSGTYQSIGTENRQTAIRLLKTREGVIERFEVRPIDGTSNPYLVLGSLIGAGVHGIKNRATLPKEIESDPALLPEDMRPRPLACSLAEAIEHFAMNEFNEELYGSELRELIVTLRKIELENWDSSEPIEKKLKYLMQRY